MERLHSIDGDELARKLSATDGHLPSWNGLGVGEARPTAMEEVLASTRGWDSLVEKLWQHFRSHSPEPFDRFVAFRWRSSGLQPVIEPDPVRLDDLIGYERERELLIRNTEMLVAGRQANNVLLYGPRGTGKSSTVKALINEYKERGLRLVQVERPDLNDFPDIVAELRRRPERFIVFLDDLAFELRENEYAHLKGLLEGGLETRPVNVAVYATSNRRHLVDERFSDRDDPQDVVHVTDTYQHKLSLADRFGIRILLPAADQSVYLAIVEGLARKRGLAVPVGELHREALRWSTTHNGLSPRSAQQFVDHLEGSAVLESGVAEE
jgi:predicted AAA+ superfamily ATPase